MGAPAASWEASVAEHPPSYLLEALAAGDHDAVEAVSRGGVVVQHADPDAGVDRFAMANQLRDHLTHGVHRHGEPDPGVGPAGAVDRGIDTDQFASNVKQRPAAGAGDGPADPEPTPPARGQVSINGLTATYIPNADYNGPDAFEFAVTDGISTSVPETVTVEVLPVNDPPPGGMVTETPEPAG